MGSAPPAHGHRFGGNHLDKQQPARPTAPRKSLDALDTVLASLPEAQYDHQQAAPEQQPAETKPTAPETNPAADTKPEKQDQNRRGRRPKANADAVKQPVLADAARAEKAPAASQKEQSPAPQPHHENKKPAQSAPVKKDDLALYGRISPAQNNAPAQQKPAAQNQPAQQKQAAQNQPAPQKQTAQNQPAPQKQTAQNQPAQQKQQAGRRDKQKTAGRQKGAVPQGQPAQQNRPPKQQTAKQPVVKQQPAQQAQPDEQPKRRGRPPRSSKNPPLKIIPLGGLGEIGKNMTAYEYGDDIIIVDCGLAFPDEEMLGVDLVIPDFTFLEENRDRLRGLVVTHGHEDHIGAIPYLLQTLNIPVYSTRFTIALIEGKLREQGILNRCKLNVVKPRDTVTLGCMGVEFITVNHSIPDACALAIHTPAGVVIQTGDFKVDYTPARGEIIDLARFGELGSHGVLALLADSTNAERPGSTPSERTVGDSFDLLFKNAGGKRILVATFSSNVYRVQQVIETAVRFGRKVAMVGRSMENVMAKALELGYLDAPEGTVVTLDTLNRMPDREAVIVTTGSQGEAMSGLTRMAMGDHRKVTITTNDLIIVSAYPIPGNEKFVGRVVNELMRLGAEVVYEKYSEIHVSGHACQDEQKLMLALTKPKYFIPVHGEYKHLMKHAGLAKRMGMADENVMIPELGRVIEVSDAGISATSTVTAGAVLVDGLGVGDVGSVVLRDRKRLGEDGLIIVAVTLDGKTGAILSGPDIVSRGFVYVREAEDMIGETRNVVRRVLEEAAGAPGRDWANLKLKIRDAASNYLYGLTKRSPMILPVIEEVKK